MAIPDVGSGTLYIDGKWRHAASGQTFAVTNPATSKVLAQISAADTDDVRDAEKAAREKGIDVVGWYHSHPDHPAAPSQYDQDHAWPWYSYIIVSVHTGVPQDMTSWRLKDDRSGFLEEKIAPMKVSAAN